MWSDPLAERDHTTISALNSLSIVQIGSNKLEKTLAFFIFAAFYLYVLLLLIPCRLRGGFNPGFALQPRL